MKFPKFNATINLKMFYEPYRMFFKSKNKEIYLLQSIDYEVISCKIFCRGLEIFSRIGFFEKSFYTTVNNLSGSGF